MAKGKLIVLEGIDGSGKSAQYRRLCARFDEAGMAYHHIVFPRYDQESSALIRMYLNGAFGTHPSVINNADAEEKTDLYIKGRLIDSLTLAPREMRWVDDTE